MKEEYKGYEIELDEYANPMCFSITQSLTRLKNKMPTPTSCREWIDKQEKRKFKRIPILRINQNECASKNKTARLISGEATSLVGVDECWVVFDKDRNKRLCDSVIIFTQENKKIMENIVALKNKIVEMEEEINNLMTTTERLKPDMMEIP